MKPKHWPRYDELIAFGRATKPVDCPTWLDCGFEGSEDHSWTIVDKFVLPDGTLRVERRQVHFAQTLPGGSLLTDPQHENTLRTIRWFLLLMRRGASNKDSSRLPACCDGERQTIYAGTLFNLFRYVRLHGLSGYESLSEARTEDILSKVIWGVETLLDFDQRVAAYLETIGRLPHRPQHSGGKPRANMHEIARVLGAPINIWQNSSSALARIQRAAKAQGMYVEPKNDVTDKRISRTPQSEGSVRYYIHALQGLYSLRYFSLDPKIDRLDLINFAPWPGERPRKLARARTQATVARLSEGEQRKHQQQLRTPTLTIQSGLRLVDAAIDYVINYADYLLELRDHHFPKILRESSTTKGLRQARNHTIDVINQTLRVANPTKTCPWPFKGLSINLKNAVRHYQKHFFTREDLAPLVERINAGEISWNRAAREIGLGKNNGDQLCTIWRRLTDPLSKQNLTGRPSLQMAVNVYLPAACYIVLAAFSARREQELLGIRDNCIPEKGDGRYIEIYSAKYLRAWELFPCVPIMKYLVEVLLRWSAPARKHSNDDRIFQVYHAFDLEPYARDFTTDQSLKVFAQFTGVELKDVHGNQVDISDHQFRRLFANLFLHRFTPNVAGKLEALTHQLRQLDPSVTEHYVREAVSGQVFDETCLEMTAVTLTNLMTGKTKARGRIAEHFLEATKRLESRFRSTIEVVTEQQAARNYEQWLREQVKERAVRVQMAVTPLPWVQCYGRSIPLRRYNACNDARERTELAPPNMVNANIETCRGCPNHLELEDHLPCIRSHQDLMKAAANNVNNPPALRAICERHTSHTNQSEPTSRGSKEELEEGTA